jgi:hypothetical protein
VYKFVIDFSSQFQKKKSQRKNNFLKIKTLIMGDSEQKANALIAEAEKKLTSSKGFLGSLFG